MDLNELQRHWHCFGETDPLWAILTDPSRKDGKWEADEFFRTGRDEIAGTLENVQALFAQWAPEIKRKGRALDFGCGVGRLTQALCDYFGECHGVDIAPSMIEWARQFNRYGSRCIYHVNERPDLELFASGTFDFIYSHIVLQHMEPVFSRKYITELVRVLAPGGALVFQIPDRRLRTAGDGPLPGNAFAAGIAALVDALVVESGSEFPLPLRVRNLGGSPWPAAGLPDGKYHIVAGDHWLTSAGEMLLRDDRRASLPKDVAPGEEVGISFRIEARLPPGDYIIEIDLVQEQVGWFETYGSRTLRIPARVMPRPAPAASVPAAPAPSPPPTPEFQPMMEVFGIERDEVVSLLESSGARLVQIQEDFHAPGWQSFHYYATR